MQRKVTFLASILALVAAGCSDEDPKPQVSVAITAPADGTTFTMADDLDPATAGLQIDVAAKAAGFSGTIQGALFVDGKASSINAQVSGSELSFARVTLSGGAHALKVVASEGELKAEALVSVVVDDTPLAPGLAIAAPAAGAVNLAADLDSAELGVQVDVTINLTNLVGGNLRVCFSASSAPGSACKSAPGKSIAQQATPAAATATVRVTLTDGQGQLSAEHEDASGVVTVSQPVALTVDGTPPTLEFAAPTQNQVMVRNPFQVLLRTDAEPGRTVTVTGGTAPVELTIEANGEAMGNVTAAEGTVQLRADVSDASGNPAPQAVVTVTVDTEACPLTLVNPASATPPPFGSAADKDGDPANGLQIDVMAVTSDPAGRPGECTGRTADLYVDGVKQSTATVAANGSITFADVNIEDGAKDMQVQLQLIDEHGNVASTSFTATVVLTGPALVLWTDTMTRNLINDRDYTTAGIQVQAVVEASLLQGGNVYLCSNIPNSPDAAGCLHGGYVVSPVVEHKTIQTPFYGVTLADGLNDLTAEVVDGAGNVSASPVKSFMVDSVPPKVTAISVEQDDGDGLLNATELPAGTQARVAIDVTGADARPLTVVNKDGTVFGTANVTGTHVVVLGTLANGAHELTARVTSANGNPNLSASPLIENPEAVLALTVDRGAPTLNVESPNKRYLNKNDDTVKTTDNADFQLVVSTDNPAGSPVSFYVDGAAAQTANVSGGRASIALSLAQGDHTVRIECSDAAGNLASRTMTYTVDTLAPAVVINSPTANQQFDTFAVGMDVTVTGAEAGQLVSVSSSSADAIGSAPIDASGHAAFEVVAPSGVQTLTASVADQAGNIGTDEVTIDVRPTGCAMALIAPRPLPAMIGRAQDGDLDPANGAQVAIEAKTLDCMGLPAELWIDGVRASTVTANATTGQVLFSDVRFNDGANSSVEIRMTNGALQTSRLPFQVKVKLTGPDLIASPAPASGTLYLVAKGNPNINGTTYVQDAVLGDVDGDLALTIQAVNAVGGKLTIALNGTALQTLDVIATPESFGGPVIVNLPQNSAGTFSITLSDPFGNTGKAEFPIAVDVVAPAAPTVTHSLLDNRAATVGLGWTSTGDDGMTGNLTGHEIRYLTSSAAGTGLTCPSLDQSTLTSAVRVSNAPGGGAPNQNLGFSLQSLPPLNCYAIAVQAVDEAGNVSELIPATNLVTQSNFWTETVVSGQAASSWYGLSMDSGDFDKNGASDLAVGAYGETPAGAVYIYYGSATPAATNQKLVGTVANEYFGYKVATGDLNADGTADLVVSARGFTSSLGRVFIYFGRPGQMFDPASAIELRGRTAAGWFGYGIRVLKDINGDGFDELAVGAPREGTAGYAFLFFGRSEAAWRAARTSIDSTTVPATAYLSAASASRVIAGGTTGDRLGARDGFTTLGDLDADGMAEFAVPSSRDTVNKLTLFNGATVTGLAGRDVLESDAIAVLTHAATGGMGTYEGLGATAIGGTDFNLDGFPDLIASQPHSNSIWFHPGDRTTRSIGAAYGAPLTNGDPLVYFGGSIASADLNGDSRPDLAASSSTTGTTLNGAGTVWFYFNTGSARPFDQAGTVLKGMTMAVEIGDFNGDAKPDVALAAPTDGTGKVKIYAP